jgi:DNA replication protein DnaC
MGDIGTGKTALAMLVSKAALQAGRTVAIYSLPRLLSLIRESIEHDEGVVGFLERLSAVDLLHIDDVGAENRTDWALEQLYTIVNTRYEERRSIVLTTNLTHDELAEQVGERIVSRLVEMCGDTVVPLYGHDRRRQPPEESAARALA